VSKGNQVNIPEPRVVNSVKLYNNNLTYMNGNIIRHHRNPWYINCYPAKRYLFDLTAI